MYSVTVYPESLSPYVSQIYTGLYDLVGAGKIKLHFSHRFFHRARMFNKNIEHTLWLDVTDLGNGINRKIYFDMIDGASYTCKEELKKADIYVKRGYHEASVNELGQDLGRKVIPFGLHYESSSESETLTQCLKRTILYNFIHSNYSKKTIKCCKQTVGHPLKLLLKKYNKFAGSRLILPLLVKHYEVSPDVPAEPNIFYRTRVYSPKEAPAAYQSGQLKDLNDMRVKIVLALRNHFGKQFIGGLRHSAFTEKYHPECIFPKNINMKEHINIVKKSLICIDTSGLHGSTGWKFPEYLAASRCIVSEPLKYKLPVPIEKQKHYLPFTTPIECVEACEKILSDEKLAISMRQENFIYYENYVKPSKLIWRCIKTAFC